ncbi:MAG: undecaprenyl-phosphate glucose phosphotransferase [Chloroflexota bacterium]
MSANEMGISPADYEVPSGPSAFSRLGKAGRRRDARLAAMLAPLDFILAYLAFALAWWLRYSQGLVSEVTEQNFMTLEDYFLIQVAFAGLLVLVCGAKGLYRPSLGRSWVDESLTVFSSAMISTAVLIIAVFYYRPFSYSRAIFIFALLVAVVFLAAERLVVRQTLAQLRKRGMALRQAIIVGAGEHGRRIMQSIVAEPDLGYQIVGFVDDERTEDIGRFRALGSLEQLPEVVAAYAVDEVIVALPSHSKAMHVIKHCATHDVEFRVAPDFYELSLDRVDVDYLHGIPLIAVREPTMSGWNRLVKRTTDVAIATLALLVLSPVMLLAAAAIKVDSPGPVLFRQLRTGRGGREFWFYKFRSMRADAEEVFWDLVEQNEATGPIFKIKNDPRVTRVGRFIRRTSIDELPQLLNVLKGDMSLVGPRPPIPHEVERYEPWHRRRLDVPPGITGLWQVSGRSLLTFDEMVLLDLWYIENWSLWLDLKIILRTVPAVLFVRGAF